MIVPAALLVFLVVCVLSASSFLRNCVHKTGQHRPARTVSKLKFLNLPHSVKGASSLSATPNAEELGDEVSSELEEVKRKLERAETRLEKALKDGNEKMIELFGYMVVELQKEKNKLIPEPTAANVPIKREKLTGEEKELFTYFRNNPEPSCFGFTFELPDGLVFPFMTKEALQNKMFVRPCFERIKSIIENRLDTVDENGVIFTGPQGNGKSWCSLFLLWNFVHQQRTVVYESCEDNVTYVIKSNGDMYSKSGSADKISVPELKDRKAIYIFDATAKAHREPAASRAFLIVTSSCNDRNYAQSKRRPGILRCCIPSYSREELENICDYFDVSVEEVRRRCLEIGPSIRYILVNDFNSSKTQTENVAKRVKADDLDRYIDDMQTVSGDDSDISACLLAAIADELQFEDPNQAYEHLNVKWEFASKNLAEIVVRKMGKNAVSFMRNFITEVNKDGFERLKGISGSFMELIIEDFLCSGVFKKCRQLSRDGVSELELSPKKLWENKIKIQYCFQLTTSKTHTIHLETIRKVCNHVRQKYGEEEKVVFMFVVPTEVVEKGNFKRTQSFKSTQIQRNERGETGKREVQAMFNNLPEDVREDLRNLEQWVICYEET